MTRRLLVLLVTTATAVLLAGCSGPSWTLDDIERGSLIAQRLGASCEGEVYVGRPFMLMVGTGAMASTGAGGYFRFKADTRRITPVEFTRGDVDAFLRSNGLKAVPDVPTPSPDDPEPEPMPSEPVTIVYPDDPDVESVTYVSASD